MTRNALIAASPAILAFILTPIMCTQLDPDYGRCTEKVLRLGSATSGHAYYCPSGTTADVTDVGNGAAVVVCRCPAEGAKE